MNPGNGDFIDLLSVLLKRRRFLFWNTLLVSALVLGSTFLLPVRYKATATLLFPKESGQTLLGLSALAQQFDLSRQVLTGASTSAQVYLAILKSRTIADAIIREFGLEQRYGVKNVEAARRRLGGLTDFNLSSSGVIEVSVQDTDRDTAARMANAFIDHLDRLNQTIRMSEGRRTRMFIEARLAETQDRLHAAEDSLRNFQETHPGVALPADVAAAAGAVAEIMAERIALSAELEVLQGSLFPDSAPVLRKQSEVRALDRELETLPTLSLEIARRYRDVKVQQTVFELLTAQYEEARIRESKDVSTVDVLDRAVPPIRKSFPRRGLMTLMAIVVSFVLGLVIVAFLEAMDRIRPGEDPRLRAHVAPGSLLERMLFGKRDRSSP